MRLFFTIFAVFLFVACHPPNEILSQESTETSENEGAVEQIRTPFAVHEWGLLRITTAGSEVATSGLSARSITEEPRRIERAPIEFEKPIIYFRPLDGFDPATEITVEIEINDGVLHEVWPVEEVIEFGSRHTFGPLRILQNENCSMENIPANNDPFCVAITANGGICETAEIRRYLRPVQNCLEIANVVAPVLLYNGIFNSEITPVSVEYDPATSSVTITNTGSFPVGPLWTVSIDNDENNRHYHRIDRLQPNESQTFLPEQQTFSEIEHEVLLSDISTALIEFGLTENEAADFVAAWRPNVLNARPPRVSPSWPWLVFGFFDPSFIDATLPINVTPTPAEMIRVLAFSLETQAW